MILSKPMNVVVDLTYEPLSTIVRKIPTQKRSNEDYFAKHKHKTKGNVYVKTNFIFLREL